MVCGIIPVTADIISLLTKSVISILLNISCINAEGVAIIRTSEEAISSLILSVNNKLLSLIETEPNYFGFLLCFDM